MLDDRGSTLTIPTRPLTAHEDPEADGPARVLSGKLATLTTTLATGLSLYALYWVVGIIQPQIYRVSFLLLTLVLTFLVFPAHARWRSRVIWLDWVLIASTLAALVWPIIDFDQFVYRAATPLTIDLVLGALTTIVVLEATRRTVGPILPVTAICFLLYGYYGPSLELIGLELFAHRGYDVDLSLIHI